jgi:hypothetical protein
LGEGALWGKAEKERTRQSPSSPKYFPNTNIQQLKLYYSLLKYTYL